MKLVECVPNFSNGRDPAVIDAIAAEPAKVAGIRVLDVDPGADTNRTVLTFVGPPDAVVEAAYRVIRKAAELIDMRHHTGAHARHGATDVCPFVPVTGVTMDDCAALARRLGKRVGAGLGIPVYLYEHAASTPERRNLAVVRAGEYEALSTKLVDPKWKPDFGPAAWTDAIARSGVVTIGARPFLIAYNINLNTRDKRFAQDIAYEIREKGRARRDGNIAPDYFRGDRLRYRIADGQVPCGICGEITTSLDAVRAHFRDAHGRDFDAYIDKYGQKIARLEGKIVKKPGQFEHCKAIGWVIPDYGCAQVTMNLTDHVQTPVHEVLESVRELARERGLVVTGSELVGVVPYDAMQAAARYYQRRHNGSTALPWRDMMEIAVRSMGLRDVAEFDVDKKVLGLPEAPDDCLMSMPTRDLVDEVSRETPAPGGGSVAALSGALGGGLLCMVSNLAIGKVGYEAQSPELDALASELQELKDRLIRAVDTDTDAFNSVLQAMRLPRRTAADKKARRAAIQEGYKAACRVPLRTAEQCLRVLEVAEKVAELGLPASITDAGVAALMACAGVEGAVYNVRINLPSIDDAAFRAEMDAELSALVARARQLRDSCDARVRASFA